ncbi:hypothetical protein PRIPAC_87584 [Pristionchus pacificus]|uniref:Uncharacterized protein n=1 Tax=Pristionchus pacificus TaxID=54126 RepID=A0A2A6CXK2_PRIPA|nr:hypothetical protein PRIPAC_87584 [Pristionchus pacificus]|eukprot:PDM82816.1 hypothetical protein PRIPAC_37209 [Pristionchus pacificus]
MMPHISDPYDPADISVNLISFVPNMNVNLHDTNTDYGHFRKGIAATYSCFCQNTHHFLASKEDQHTCQRCSPGNRDLMEIVCALNRQGRPTLLLICTSQDGEIGAKAQMPDLFKYPNIATRLVAMMVPVTSRYEQSIMQALREKHPVHAVGDSINWSKTQNEQDGAIPRVMLCLGWTHQMQ